MRISDWSSDVCSSDLIAANSGNACGNTGQISKRTSTPAALARRANSTVSSSSTSESLASRYIGGNPRQSRSEEHTSELQSLMRSSYAVICLNNKLPELMVRFDKHQSLELAALLQHDQPLLKRDQH